MEIQLNDVTLYYEKTGEGDPVILIHGNGEDHTIFDAVVPLLSKYYTVYTPDSRGHGQSSPVESFSYDAMAEDIRNFIEGLGLEKPALYGFSDGGIIGILLASAYPQLLSAMVISGANLTPDGLTDFWYETFEKMYQESGDPKIKMILEQPDIPQEVLSRIRIPVLVTAGSNDMIKAAHTRMIAETIPDSALEIYEGEDHLSYVVHQPFMADRIIRFLSDRKA